MLFVRTLQNCVDAFPQNEGGIQVLAGSSIQPNSWIHIENSLAGKACQKNDSTKLNFQDLQT
jgi:hypothetical protein